MTIRNRKNEKRQELKELEREKNAFKAASELNALRRKSLHDMAFSTTLFVSGLFLSSFGTAEEIAVATRNQRLIATIGANQKVLTNPLTAHYASQADAIVVAIGALSITTGIIFANSALKDRCRYLELKRTDLAGYALGYAKKSEKETKQNIAQIGVLGRQLDRDAKATQRIAKDGRLSQEEKVRRAGSLYSRSTTRLVELLRLSEYEGQKLGAQIEVLNEQIKKKDAIANTPERLRSSGKASTILSSAMLSSAAGLSAMYFFARSSFYSMFSGDGLPRVANIAYISAVELGITAFGVFSLTKGLQQLKASKNAVDIKEEKKEKSDVYILNKRSEDK